MTLLKPGPANSPAVNNDRIGAAFDQIDANKDRIEAVNGVLGGRIQQSAERIEAVNSVLGNRIAGLADTLNERDQTLSEEIADLVTRSDLPEQSGRPGEAPSFFTQVVEGQPGAFAPIPLNLVATDSDGKVIRLTAPGSVAPIAATRIEPGRLYKIRFAVRRRVDPPDPNNHSVRLGMRWMGPGKAALPVASSIVADISDLTVASGRRVLTATILAPGGAQAGAITAPAGTIYARPFVQIFGDDATTDVDTVGPIIDVTDSGGLAPDVSAFDSRLQAQESADAGARLNTIEAQLGGAQINDYYTRATVAATRISNTVNVIRVIRFDLTTPEAPSYYTRAAVEPNHPRKVQSADGAWWELYYRQDIEFETQGAKGDGSASDTLPVQQLLAGGPTKALTRYKVGDLTMKVSAHLGGLGREYISYPTQQNGADAWVFPSSPALAASALEQTSAMVLAPGSILERLNIRRSGLILPTPGQAYTAVQARNIASAALAGFAGTALVGVGTHDVMVRDAAFLGHDLAVDIDFNGQGGRTFFQNVVVDGNGGFDWRNAGDITGLFNVEVWPAVGASTPGVSPGSNFHQLQRRKPAFKFSGDPTKGSMDWAYAIATMAYGHDQNYVFTSVANFRTLFASSDYTFDNANSIAGFTIDGTSDNVQLVYPTSVGHKIGAIINSTNSVDLAAAIQGGYFGNTDASIDLRDGDLIAADMSLRAAVVGLRVGANAGSFRFAPARSSVGNLVSFDPAWPSASAFGRIELPSMTTPAPVFAFALTDAQRKRLTILGATPQHGGVINQMLRPLEIISDGAAFSLWNTAASDPNSAIHDILSDASGGISFRGLTADRAQAVTVLRVKNGGLTPLGVDVAGPIAGTASIAAGTTLQSGIYTVATLPTPGIKGRIAFASNARALLGGGVLQAAGAGSGSHVTDIGTGWVITGTVFQAVA